MNKYFNPWIYPPVPGSWEVRNDYEIIVHLVGGNSYHAVLVGRNVAIASLNTKTVPLYQEREEFDVVLKKCEELWVGKVDPVF